MDGEKKIDSNLHQTDTRVIDVILYTKSNEMPSAHMFLGSSFQKVQLMQLRHFWIFEIDNLSPDITSFELHLSPDRGPTTLHTMCFSNVQPFIFIDSLPENEMVPFNDFFIFFNTATTNKNSLSFSFLTDDPIQKIDQFIHSFDDKYFLWSLLYISAQPWFELFQYNKDLNQLLLSVIPPYIMQHFYEQQRYIEPFDAKEYISTFESPIEIQNENLKVQNFDPAQYISADVFIDTFFHFLRVQIGEGFVYLLSLFFDFDKDFPFTSYIPPLEDYQCSSEVNKLLSALIISYMNYEDEELLNVYERIYYCILMTATPKFDLDMSPLFKVLENQLNMNVIAKIINDRMILTETITPDTLKFIINAVPNFDNVIKVFKTKSTFIPLEWIKTVSDLFEIDDLTDLVISSLRNSVPVHYKEYFARVTKHGALVQDANFDDSKTILQPGSIVQTNTKIGNHTILCSGSIAPTGSELQEGTYARRNGIIPREKSVVSPTAVFQHPVLLKRGVTIDDGAVICQNSSVGSGTQVCNNAIVGPGAMIGSGCIIGSGEKVPGSTVLPAGFRYSKKAVEFEQKVPEIIQRYSIMFLKRQTGFADLETVLSFDVEKKVDIITEYFVCLRDYPCEAGRQIALCKHLFEFLDQTSTEILIGQIFSIFGANTILLAGTYWTESERSTNNNNEQTSVWDRIILELCNRAIKQFHLSVDDLCNERVIDALHLIINEFSLMLAKGVSEDDIQSLKRLLYDMCDNAVLRLKLGGYPEKSEVIETFNSLISQINLF